MKKPCIRGGEGARGVLEGITWRRLVGGAVVAFSFVFLGGILLRNWSELASYDLRPDFRFVLPAFVTYSLALWIAVVGWGLIVRGVARDDRGSTSLRKHLKYYVYSRLLQRLPLPLVYVLGRSEMYENEGIARSVTVTITIVEWILLLVSGLFVCVLLLPFVALPLPAGWQSPWVGLALIGVGVLLLHPRAFHFAFRVLGKEEEARALSYKTALLGMLAYSLVWLLGGGVLFLIIQSIYDIALAHLPAVTVMWVASGVFTTALFAAIPGFGSTEVSLTLLLSNLVEQPIAVVVALLMRVYLILFDLVWAGIAVLTL